MSQSQGSQPHGSQPQAFRLKGTMPALTLLHLLTEDLDAIESQLVDHLSQMPMFFLYAPILVELRDLPHGRIDLDRLGQLLRKHKLVPVAVRNPTEAQQLQAVSAGWGVLQTGLASTAHSAPQPRPAGASANPRIRQSNVDPLDPRPGDPGHEEPEEPTPSHSAVADPAPPPVASTERSLPGLTIRTPVRSGQVIHAVGGDLVVLAPVSSGAELIADGNIHIYAPLRGRALAGAQGDSDVSIFCFGLEAEFLSIAGRYLMADQIDKKFRGQPTRAYVEGDQVQLVSL